MCPVRLCQDVLAAVEGQDVKEADLIAAICRAPRPVAVQAALRYQALTGQVLAQVLMRNSDALHRKALAALCQPRRDLLLSWLRGAILDVSGTPESSLLTLIHILCTRTDAELSELLSSYQTYYGADLALDLGAALARAQNLPDTELLRRAFVSLLACFGAVERTELDDAMRQEISEVRAELDASKGQAPPEATGDAPGRPRSRAATLLVSLLSSGCYALEPFDGDLQADPYVSLIQACRDAGVLGDLGQHAFICLRLRACPEWQWAYLLRYTLVGCGAGAGLTEAFTRVVILCYDCPHDLLNAYARISRSQDKEQLLTDIKAAPGSSNDWVEAVCVTLLSPREQ